MTIPLRKILIPCQFCLILFSFFACENNLIVSHHDLNEQIVVLSLLCPAFERQEVYVGSSLPQMPPIDVSGARVQIKDSTNTYTLKEVQPGLYRDVDGAFEVVPGRKYDLYVETPNGKRVSSNTHVPGEFEITNIAQGDTLEYSTYFSGHPNFIWSQKIPNVEYSSSKEALVYQIWVTLEDTSFRHPPTPLTLETGCDFPSISTGIDTFLVSSAKLVVFAWDSTYSKYATYWAMEGAIPVDFITESFSEFHQGKTEYCPKSLSNITGGVGIFGSANAASVEFYLRYSKEINP